MARTEQIENDTPRLRAEYETKMALRKESLEKSSGVWYASRIASYRVRTQNPWAWVFQK